MKKLLRILLLLMLSLGIVFYGSVSYLPFFLLGYLLGLHLR